MPRIRSIKPETLYDGKLASVSPEAELTFVHCWIAADDEGLFRLELATTVATLFPRRAASLNESQVEGWLEKLAALRCIRWRETRDGGRVVEIVNWKKHQRIDRPSKSFLRSELAPIPRDTREACDTETMESLSPESKSPESTNEQTARSPDVEKLKTGDGPNDVARLIGATRAAIAEHYPAGPRLTLTYDNPDDRAPAARLLAEYGFEWCAEKIRQIVAQRASRKPGDPIGSMAYFARALPAEWRKERENEMDSTIRGLAKGKALAPPPREEPLAWAGRQPENVQRELADLAEKRLLAVYGSDDALERAFPSVADRRREARKYLRAEAAKAMRNGSGA